MATPEAVALLPEGTLVATVACPTPSMPDLELRAAGAQELPPTLPGVVGFVRTGDGDALLVSDAALLDGRVLAGLEEALANDSACSTVSVDDDSRPIAPGLPPPAIDGPRAGVVLVRRDDLVLAIDEAELTGRFMAAPMEPADADSIVAQLLVLLDRPGFVHRAYGLGGDSGPVKQRSGGRRVGRERVTRRLLQASLEKSGSLTPRKALLLDVYRRRPGVRVAVDAILRTGMTVTAGARRIKGQSRTDG